MLTKLQGNGQFGLIEIKDDGETPCFIFKGKTSSGSDVSWFVLSHPVNVIVAHTCEQLHRLKWNFNFYKWFVSYKV